MLAALLLAFSAGALSADDCNPPKAHRKEVLSTLAKCSRVPPRPNNCDDIAGEVLTWYECGDSALLDPLLAASAHSDEIPVDQIPKVQADLKRLASSSDQRVAKAARIWLRVLTETLATDAQQN
jgi:hypothetical protein